MKLALFFAFIMACANAFAQQAPRAMVRDQVPGEIEHRAKQAPGAPQRSNAELSELLRAQTTAIKALSSKLDSLEERIRKIERGPR